MGLVADKGLGAVFEKVCFLIWGWGRVDRGLGMVGRGCLLKSTLFSIPYSTFEKLCFYINGLLVNT
jgi:hypothetical protein